jgi:signal transduction histidine kinase|tara:strand:- start:5951 stop:7723 length:1773 start_codon:yes stop_codon:yes gene_type:complete
MQGQSTDQSGTWGIPHLTAMDADGPFGPRAYAAMYTRQATLNLIIVALSVFGSVIVTWRQLPWRLELVWGILFGGSVIWQAHRRFIGGRKELTEERARRILSKACRHAFVAGVGWAVTAFALPYLNGPSQVAISLVALSLTVAVTTTLSSVPRAAVAFIVPVVLTYVMVFITRGSLPYFALGGLGLAFLVVILIGMRINAISLKSELVARSEALTARKALASGQDLWSEFSGSAEAFALFDENKELLLWNEAYRRLIGADHLSSGQYWEDIDAKNSSRLPEDIVMRGLGPVGPDFTQTFSLSNRWYQTTIRPLSNGHIAINHADITTLKDNERELLVLQGDLMAARDRAQAANEAKTDFLAKMSHELRTPLNAVIGFSELMVQDYQRERIDPARHAGYARIISDSGQHLLSIVNDLLDLARIEARQMKLSESNVDLAEMVRSARLLIEGREENLRLSFSEKLPDVPIIARADRRLLRQAVLNLIENAVKFCHTDPFVVLSVVAAEDGGAHICVEDNGIGIPEHLRDTVTDPFVQAEPSETRQYGGVGLGLALVRQFAELHGGNLLLFPREGGGTRACLTVPADRIVPSAE